MPTSARKSDSQPFLRPKRAGVGDHVLEDLRKNILNGKLERGAKLPNERDLAEAYGVSGGTVREAIRALTAMRLVEVRHGSGSYITADVEQLIAMSMHSIIQIERIGVPQVLGVLAVLNSYAAELAVANATEDDIALLRAGLNRMKKAVDVENIVGGLTDFLFSLALASHNPLLVALCKFLDGLQIELTRHLCGGSFAKWRATALKLDKERNKLVDAIKARDAVAARRLTRAYHQRAIEVIMALPNSDTAWLADPKVSKVIAARMDRAPQAH